MNITRIFFFSLHIQCWKLLKGSQIRYLVTSQDHQNPVYYWEEIPNITNQERNSNQTLEKSISGLRRWSKRKHLSSSLKKCRKWLNHRKLDTILVTAKLLPRQEPGFVKQKTIASSAMKVLSLGLLPVTRATRRKAMRVRRSIGSKKRSKWLEMLNLKSSRLNERFIPTKPDPGMNF